MGGKVIFTEKPRNEISEIFGREKEINNIKNIIGNNDWISILGPRMIGKTSLSLSILNYYNKKGYEISYIDLRGSKNSKDFFIKLYENMPKKYIEKIKNNLDYFGINISGAGINFKFKNEPSKAIDYILKNINDRKIIIVLDEFQEIIYGINYILNILHNLMMNNKNLIFIFTGSSIGLLKTLLDQKGSSPLAGRNPVKIVLRPWDKETAKKYLISGLNTCKKSYNEIDNVINNLGTITGWLNFYGERKCLDMDDALDDSIKEAISVAKKEIKNVINKSPWRKKALKMMIYGSTYSEMLKELKVSTSTLANFLDRLERLYLIERIESNYYIIDNVYKKAI